MDIEFYWCLIDCIGDGMSFVNLVDVSVEVIEVIINSSVIERACFVSRLRPCEQSGSRAWLC